MIDYGTTLCFPRNLIRTPGLIALQVSNIIRHPHYSENGQRGFPNDIAVLQLSSTINLNDRYASAVKMASSGEDFTEKKCIITGWGKLGKWKPSPNVLQVNTL